MLVEKDILVPLVPTINQPNEIPIASSSNLGESHSDLNTAGYTDGPVFNEIGEDLHTRYKTKVCILNS